jgi:hypothetical protein
MATPPLRILMAQNISYILKMSRVRGGCSKNTTPLTHKGFKAKI